MSLILMNNKVLKLFKKGSIITSFWLLQVFVDKMSNKQSEQGVASVHHLVMHASIRME